MIRRLGRLSAICAGVLCFAAWCAAAEFSADTVTKMGGMTMTGKVWRQGNKMRQEMDMGTMRHIIIVRPDKKATWMLDPKSKTYMEMPYNPKMSDPSMLKNEAELKKIAVKKKLGTEKVGGFVCDKFQLTFKDKARGTATVWVSKQLEWPLKTESKRPQGAVVTETKNIKVARQASSLFEIPKGYKKTTMPAHRGMGGMPGRPSGPPPAGAPGKPK